METKQLNTTYVRDSGGLMYGLVEAIDALLPALPGNPEAYVDERGRLNVELVMQGTSPHSHSTGAAADLILELWNGAKRGGLYKMIGHAGGVKAKHLANALRALADRLEERA